MIDPLSYPFDVAVQGPVIKIEGNVVVIRFDKSGALFDENDIWNRGQELKVGEVRNSQNLDIGQVVTVKGNLVDGINTNYRILAREVYPSKFEPFGIDWKSTVIIILVSFLTLLLISFFKKFAKGSN